MEKDWNKKNISNGVLSMTLNTNFSITEIIICVFAKIGVEKFLNVRENMFNYFKLNFMIF